VQVVEKLDGLHGCCTSSDSSHLIQLASDTVEMMNETLIEEWSHMLRYEMSVPIHDDHDSIFWAILGTITMAWRDKPYEQRSRTP
jgi:hypothetical protein